MRKVTLFLVFLIASLMLMAVTNKNLKTVEVHVIEQTKKDNGKVQTEYDVSFKLPDKIKKVMTFPKINSGEIYVYVGDTKKTYLPIFNQVTVEKISKDDVLSKISKDIILKMTGSLKGRESFFVDDHTEIRVTQKKQVDDFILPEKLQIYLDKALVSEIEFTNIKVNKVIDDKIFELSNENN